MKRVSSWLAPGLALLALAAPASAQVTSVSVPDEDPASASAANLDESWFAIRLTVAPLAKWKIDLAHVDPARDTLSMGTADPSSKVLLAAESAFLAGDGLQVTLGGWYENVGPETFTTYSLSSGFVVNLDTDLKVWEGHAGLFYRGFGVQGGVVRTTGTVNDATLAGVVVRGTPGVFAAGAATAFAFNATRAQQIGDFPARTDVHGYVVYKGTYDRVGYALGAGAYRFDDGGTGRTEQRTVPSAFVNASVDLWHGLGVDASYWYIARSELAETAGLPTDDGLGRLTIGVSYTFN